MVKPTAPRSRRPSREALLEFIAENPENSSKREISRSFGLKGDDRVWLRNTLRDFVAEGLIEGGRSAHRGRPGLPPVMVLEITGVDNDGDLVAVPAAWKHDLPRPSVHLTGSSRALACGPGDRVLARITNSGGAYEGKIMRVLPSPPSEILGVIEDSGRELRLTPVNRRTRTEFIVDDAGDAVPGDVVVADVVPGEAYGPARVRVRTRVGSMTDARTLSLTAIHEHGLPDTFPDDVLAEAAAAKVPALGDRTDFRDVPFVTIDPETARDFDDAVWAEPDTDGNDGWVVRVAIADAAHYVTPGSALDAEAKNRGNSAYFPDRVVPMLPESLSASLCSLEEGVDRACMVATLWLDAQGLTTRHKFERGLMRSVKRLTYAQVQTLHDDGGDKDINALVENLYGAHKALTKAREVREPLEIETIEVNVVLGDDGRVERVEPMAHITSHQLIENMMIAANVAAAEVLTEAQAPCMYRVHDQPERERIVALAEFLDSLGLRLDKGQRPTPRMFNGFLRKVAETSDGPAVNQATLRAQAKAEYSAHANPHFGLNLTRYAHFTSPIRRYADVLVHRALITTLGLGAGGMAGTDGTDGTDGTGLEAIAQHISMTERRAVAAERDALARYLATFLADQIGAELPGRIAGVTKAGLFITLVETGADGLVPMRTLGDDFYIWDEPRHRLIGQRGHRVYALGDPVTVGIMEAVPATGGLLLEIRSGGKIDHTAIQSRPQRPGRGSPGRGTPGRRPRPKSKRRPKR
jgi:ribonuclease R